MDESLEKENPNNPILLNPVIRCVQKFLNVEDIKNCRFVCREWSPTGKLSLASRARVHIHLISPDRRPENFQSCFLNSATLFSAFQISSKCDCLETHAHISDPRTIEELTMFFEVQQKSIKELTLNFKSTGSGEKVKNIDIGSWISNSPMIQKNAKYMTKLSIKGYKKNWFILPFHLITEIKDLALSYCRINLDAGVKICTTKLKLENVTFLDQDRNKLDHIQINDIVDFCKTEKVSLHCTVGTVFQNDPTPTKFVMDLRGNAILQKLILDAVEILNGETSQWIIKHLATKYIPYSLNSQMKIKELSLYNTGHIDLFTLPDSIQKFAFHALRGSATVSCSRPIVLTNLEYLQISYGAQETDLSHFINCPRLSHLKFFCCILEELKSHWLPKNLKTLTLEDFTTYWVDAISLNLEKLVVSRLWCPIVKAKEFLKPEIRVGDLVLYHLKMNVDDDLVDFMEYRKRFNYGKRLYIGELDWKEKQLEDSALKKYVDIKSLFYVFENGEKGRAISEKAFHELIPKHMEFEA